MDKFQENVLAAVQDGLHEARSYSFATFIERVQQNFHDVASFIAANGMAVLALAVVGLICAILFGMAYNKYQEYQIELMLAEEESGKLQQELYDLQFKHSMTKLHLSMEEASNKAYKEALEIVQTEVERLEGENASLENENDTLAERNTDLMTTLTHRDEQLEDFGDALRNQRDQIFELIDEKHTLIEEVENLEDRIADLESDLESANDDKDYWEEMCDDARTDRDYYVHEAEELREEVTKLENLVELHKELAAANEEVFAEAA